MKPNKPTHIQEQEALTMVGPGWSDLIRYVYKERSFLDFPPDIITVKEKWGGLRIYTGIYNDKFDRIIMDVEKRSFSICEQCGASGKLRQEVPGSRYFTACDEHKLNSKIIDSGRFESRVKL